jgi:hypothetical protein
LPCFDILPRIAHQLTWPEFRNLSTHSAGALYEAFAPKPGEFCAALSEDPRPGAERKLTGKEEALLVATAHTVSPRSAQAIKKRSKSFFTRRHEAENFSQPAPAAVSASCAQNRNAVAAPPS